MVFSFRAPDQPGIIATVASWLAERGANIEQLEEHVEGGMFVMRVTTDIDVNIDELSNHTQSLNAIVTVQHPLRMTICYSGQSHCAHDIAWRVSSGQLPVASLSALSSHDNDLQLPGITAQIVDHPPGRDADGQAGERRFVQAVRGTHPDVVVLARYMRILSAEAINEIGVPIINIHHSFLPAFVGGKPYEEAWVRGVKMIGATAHYVTPELDAGPIIAQSVVPVTHRASVDRLKELGAEVERRTLADAVAAHHELRVARVGDRCIVFGSS